LVFMASRRFFLPLILHRTARNPSGNFQINPDTPAFIPSQGHRIPRIPTPSDNFIQCM
jgi:hypothetical protein